MVDPLDANVGKSFDLYKDEWDFFTEYYTKYREAPPRDIVERQFPDFEFYETTDGSILWYIEALHMWRAKHVLQSIITDAAAGIKDTSSFVMINKMQSELAKLGRDTRMVKDLDLVGNMNERIENLRERIDIREGGRKIIGVPSGVATLDEAFGGWQRGDFIVVAGWTGQLKALRHGTPVITRKYGWLPIEDLCIDDEIYSVDGSITKVTGVYPQGKVPIYRMHLSDGTSIDSSLDHLWQVTIRGREKLLTTRDIFEKYNGRESRYQPILPLANPIEFDHRDMAIDPYSLGLLLGDGSITNNDITLTMAVDDLNDIKPAIKLNLSDRKKSISKGVLGIKDKLAELGLLGRKSSEKFIPDSYLHNSIESRIALLRGLMDTDGTVNHQGCSFSSSSKNLAENVVELVRSLGGKAKTSLVKTPRLDSFQVRIWLPRCPFNLTRKIDKWILYNDNRTTTTAVRIRSVEKVDDDYATCITVDHKSRLFITDNYIVTHNSWLALLFAQHAWSEGYRVLYVSLEMSGLQLGYRFDTLLSGMHGEGITNSSLTHAEDITYDHYKNWLGEVMYDKHPFVVVTNEDLDEVNQNTVLAKIEQWKPDVVILDYHGLFDEASGIQGETEKTKQLSKAFKRLAIRTGVPIIDVTAVTMKDDHGERAPELHEMAWSKQLAYDSDLTLAVCKHGDVLEVVCRKTRRGRDFKFYLDWDIDRGIVKEVGKSSILTANEKENDD